MTREVFDSPSNRKTVYKTGTGIEIRPMKHLKARNKNYSTNITYYYVYYFKNKKGNWSVKTNHRLYGETITIEEFESYADAKQTADAINRSMRFLFENVN